MFSKAPIEDVVSSRRCFFILQQKHQKCLSDFDQNCKIRIPRNKGNLFEFLKMAYAENYKKLKKDGEICIIENSKKLLGGNADGKFDK